ncbi:hypothetical protein [Staphylococcus haemolyticus]|uniref:hypothetical protein n=1 Tax=Staphylococcus haemolyticus TaxID=1283 RepID=UPI0018EE4B79|nr:hypothetical protein [Staphylococcus haemolyticus]
MKNNLGDLGKLIKMGGKALKQLAAITAITDNMSKDSLQEKLVGAGEDLSILGGSAAAGTAIPVPVVGTLVGAVAGIGIGLIGDVKYKDKTVKDYVKDGINNSLNNGKNFIGDSWKGATKGIKSVFS